MCVPAMSGGPAYRSMAAMLVTVLSSSVLDDDVDRCRTGRCFAESRAAYVATT